MKPEQYWIDRGEDVIGADVLRDGVNARQAATYQVIAEWIVGQGIREVFDVGCNVAALDLFLRETGYKGSYHGVDTNEYAVRRVNQLGVRAGVMSLRHLLYDDASWETVVVKDVIEHLEGPHLLAEAFRVATKYVIVATYIPWDLHGRWIERHLDGYFTNRYNVGEVLALTESWGYELLETLDLVETNGSPNAIYVFERSQGGAA